MSATPATHFTPTASFQNIPEDIVYQILTLISIVDILALRRTCRRLYHISHARFVWLEALRKTYGRRFLPPLARSDVTSRLSTPTVEYRATRPFRFLRALSDINTAKYRATTFELEEEIAHPPPEDDIRIRSGVIGFQLLPGGRWLCLVINRRTMSDPSRAALIVWDLWKKECVAKHVLFRSSHFAHIQLDDKAEGIIFIIGFDKTRTQDPYFSAVRLPLYGGDMSPTAVERINGMKVARTPRACSVYGNLLVSADRLGHLTFWNWKEQTTGALLVGGWPPNRGKIMLLSETLVATFNPASSAFAVHAVPQLTAVAIPPSNGVSQAVPPAPPPPEMQALGPHMNFQSIVALPPPLPIVVAPNGPSMGIKRFRLPSRSLQITLPSKVPASSFYSSNAQFPDPFLAYFLVVHPENLGELYLGIVPEIDPNEPEALDNDVHMGNNGETESDEDQENDEDDENDHSGESQDAEHQASEPPFAPPPAAAANNIVPGGTAPPVPPVPVQQGPEPIWLETLRCVDSATKDTFAARGRILFTGPLDHSIAVLRSTQEGKIEIFTTMALHSKPEVTLPQRANAFRIRIPHAPQHLPPPVPMEIPIRMDLPRLHSQFNIPRLLGSSNFASMPFMPVLAHQNAAPGPSSSAPPRQSTRAALLFGATRHASSTPTEAGPSTGRPVLPLPARHRKRLRLERTQPPPPLVSEQTLTDPTAPQRANPHKRYGAYAEGDYQTLAYHAPGEVWAATMDDVSGKICLVVENYERQEVVVLDYGWDFWKENANEELLYERHEVGPQGGSSSHSEAIS